MGNCLSRLADVSSQESYALVGLKKTSSVDSKVQVMLFSNLKLGVSGFLMVEAGYEDDEVAKNVVGASGRKTPLKNLTLL